MNLVNLMLKGECLHNCIFYIAFHKRFAGGTFVADIFTKEGNSELYLVHWW